MNPSDTICAISSAVGPAARMIVRISGPLSPRVAAALCRVRDEPGAGATRSELHFSDLAVPAWLYVFRAPRSYTGDDLVEFHIPGSPVLARLLLDHLRSVGARDAEPGEFTARAFFNGRLGLTEAEGVAATISAQGEAELAAARQLMAGELARRLRPVTDSVAQTLALVEAGIDFSDEDVTFLSSEDVRSRAAEADEALESLLADSARFERLSHHPTAVLVGRPNAGKSTLLNSLAGRERAVTSPVAGTTRDVLSAEVTLERGMLTLLDVAGLDDGASSKTSPDPIERQMRERALRAVREADFVILVRDVTDSFPPPELGRQPDLVVWTKADLARHPLPGTPGGGPGRGAVVPISNPSSQVSNLKLPNRPPPPPSPRSTGERASNGDSRNDDAAGLRVSASTGENLPGLFARLDRLAFGGDSSLPALALNARHVAAIGEAREALRRVADSADAPPEVAALELREALDALGRVVGAVVPDDLLGRIFSTFCIGK